MKSVAIMLKRAPYGDLNAAEAVRHALGAVGMELKTDLLLVDGGVLLAKQGQNAAGTGFTNLEDPLRDCLEMGVAVYADSSSVREWRLNAREILEGVRIVPRKEIARLVNEAETTVVL